MTETGKLKQITTFFSKLKKSTSADCRFYSNRHRPKSGIGKKTNKEML